MLKTEFSAICKNIFFIIKYLDKCFPINTPDFKIYLKVDKRRK